MENKIVKGLFLFFIVFVFAASFASASFLSTSITEASSNTIPITSALNPLQKMLSTIFSFVLQVKLPSLQPAQIIPGVITNIADLKSLEKRVGQLEVQFSSLSVNNTFNTPNTLNVTTSLDTAGGNLILNSSFEVGGKGNFPSEWNQQLDSNSSNTYISSEAIHSGSYGLKFLGSGTGNFGISQPNTKTTPQRTYTLSAWIKYTNAAPSTFRIGFWNQFQNIEGQFKNIPISGTQDWVRVFLTITTPGTITDSSNEFPMFEVQGLTSGNLYMDDVELTEGSVLTPYNSALAQTGGSGLALSDLGSGILHSNGSGSITSTSINLSSTDITNTLSIGNGGTGQTSFTANGLVYVSSTSSALLTLDTGTSGYILQSNGSGSAPSWLSTLPVGNGGTGNTAAPSNGQLLIGNGTGYTLSTLTAGSGMTITNGSGTITLSSSGGGGSTAFSSITTGTNTSATMTVGSSGGSNATLTYSGNGIVNANEANGQTLSLAGPFTTSGAFGLTFTLTGTTGVTLPTSGTLVNSVTTTNGVSASNTSGALSFTLGAIVPTTVNGLTLASAADGFTIAGGTTSRILTVTGANITVGSTVQPTAAGTLAVKSNGANTLTLDTGGAAGLNIGTTNTNGVTIGNNSATNNTFVTLTTGGSGIITLGSNTGTGDVLVQPNAGGQAALIVNDLGSGDIFTASSSANTTKFVIQNGGNVGIGTSSPAALEDISQGTQTSGTPYILRLTGGTNTGLTAANDPDLFLNLGRVVTFTGGGSAFNQHAIEFDNPGYAFSGSAGTITNAVGLYLNNGPTANNGNTTITNSIGLMIDNVHGVNQGAGTVTNAYGLYVNQAGGTANDYGAYISSELVVGTNKTPPAHQLVYLQQDPETSSNAMILHLSANQYNTTPVADNPDVLFDLSHTIQFAGGTNLASSSAFEINAPTFTYSSGANTLTRGATVYINGNPKSGANTTLTNSYGLYIDNQQGGGTNSYGLGVLAPTGGGTNYAAVFTGGNVGIGTTAPVNTLDVLGNMAIGTYAGVNTANSNGLIVSGNVGIGTNNPAQALNVTVTANDQVAINTNTNSNFNRAFEILDSSLGAGNNLALHIGHDLTTNNTGYLGFHYIGSGAPENWLTMGFYGNDTIYNFTTTGHVGFGNVLMGNGALVVNQQNLSGSSGDIFSASSSAATKFVITNGGNIKSVAGSQWLPLSDGTTALQIARNNGTAFVNFDTTNQRVSIGTTAAPANPLDVSGSVAVGTYAGTGAGTNQLIVGGNVGIGSTNPNKALQITVSSNDQVAITATNNAGGGFLRPFEMLDSNMSTNDNLVYHLGHDLSQNNTGYLGFHYRGSANPENYLTMGFYGTDNVYNFTSTGHVGFGAAVVGGAPAIGNGALVVNQQNLSGNGDIFSASASAATKFTIGNNGTVTLVGNNTTDIITTGTNTLKLDTAGAAGITIGGTNTNAVTIGNNSGTNNTALTFTSGGTGNITLGSNTGLGDVVVQPNAGGQAALIVNDQGNGDIFTASSSANTTRFVINTSGNVGIGSTSPGQLLNIYSSATTIAQIRTTANSNVTAGLQLTGGQSNADWYVLTNRADLNGTADNLGFYKNAGTTGTKMVIQDNGNVGIGTTSPTALLQVAGTASESGDLTFYNSSNGVTHNMYLFNNSNLDVQTSVGGAATITHALYVAANGNVGLGTTTGIVFPLTVGGTTGEVARLANGGDAVHSYYMAFGSGDRAQYGFDNVTQNAAVQGSGGKGVEFNVNNATFGSGIAGILTSNGFMGLGTGITAALIGNDALVVNQTNNSGSGDIFTASQSGNTKFVINNGGNVGIGTNLPGYGLDLQVSNAASAAAQIYNTNSGANADGLIVKLAETTGTAPSIANGQQAGNSFIRFLNGNSIAQGSIDSTTGTAVTYNTTGVDFAEYFTKSANQTFTEGDVVALDGTTDNQVAAESTTGYDSHLLGVVSSSPGFSGGTPGDNKVRVGLIGQLPVKVSTENGNIQPGDLLTSSATYPGVAMKAIRAGSTIGQALESYNATGIGQISAYISKGYYNGISTDALAQGLGTTDPSTLKSMQFVTNSQPGAQPIAQSTLATSSGTLTLTTLSVTNIGVLGLATVSGDFRVKGDGLFEGMVNIVDTLTTSNSIVTKLATFFGDVVFHGTTTFLSHPQFDQDTTGHVIIPKGSDVIPVLFKTQYQNIPDVSATISIPKVANSTDQKFLEDTIFSGNIRYIVSQISTYGFVIKLNAPAPIDIPFSWTALATHDSLPTPVISGSPQVSVSPVPSITPLVSPLISPTLVPSLTPVITTIAPTVAPTNTVSPSPTP